jgi:type I restriction enzyme S subunit
LASGKGATQQNISQTLLKSWEIPVPPLDEQKRIVEALDDHLFRLDKALVELNGGLITSEVFTRSLLKAAFDGQLTNSEKNDWKTTPIGEVVDFAPKKPNHLKASQDECSFIPMVAVQEVTGAIDLSQTISHEKALSKTLTFFNEGDVLFAKVTPCMENGKVAVARGLTNQMGYGSTEFHILSPRPQLLADYLRYFLVSKDFRVNAASAMTGAVGLRRVPKSYLEEHYIPLPSLDDQRQVVDVLDFQLSIVDQLKESIHGHISRISTLRKSLLHSAFTGKLLVEGKSE